MKNKTNIIIASILILLSIGLYRLYLNNTKIVNFDNMPTSFNLLVNKIYIDRTNKTDIENITGTLSNKSDDEWYLYDITDNNEDIGTFHFKFDSSNKLQKAYYTDKKGELNISDFNKNYGKPLGSSLQQGLSKDLPIHEVEYPLNGLRVRRLAQKVIEIEFIKPKLKF